MRKHNKRHNQRMLDEEKRIREETHLVRPPRLQPKVKEAMMQPVRKEKKGRIPRMWLFARYKKRQTNESFMLEVHLLSWYMIFRKKLLCSASLNTPMQSSTNSTHLSLRETLFEHMTKRHDQNIFDKEEQIREYVRIVSPARRKGVTKETVVQQSVVKEDEDNVKPKKDKVPRM